MGRDKALIEDRGMPLIRRAVATAARVPQVQEILVALGDAGREAAYRDAIGDAGTGRSIRFIPDAPEWRGAGPLAAFEAAFAVASQPVIIVLPVDATRFPAAAYETLLKAPARGGVIVHDGRVEPLFAAYPRDAALAAVRALLQAGNRAARDLPRVLGCQACEARAMGLGERELASANEPADLEG